MHRARAWQIALVVYWLLLAVATHYPRVAIPGEIPHSDKLVHLGAFGTLAALFWFALRPRLWVALAVLVPYAALDEWLQQFFGRYTDLMDFFANTLGIAIALGALALYRRSRR